MEEAFSTEYNIPLNIDDAYELCFQGKHEHDTFECIGKEECTAKILVVNAHKDILDMKNKYHFKTYKGSIHCAGCKYEKKDIVESTTKSKNIEFLKEDLDKSTIVRLSLSDIGDHQRQQNIKLSNDERISYKKTALQNSSLSTNNTKVARTIRALVNYYEELQDKNIDLSKYFITIKKKNISFEEFFIPVSAIDLKNNKREYPYVYFGKIFVNSNQNLENGRYRCVYASKSKNSKGEEVATSFFLKDEILDKIKTSFRTALKNHCDTNRPSLMIYLYQGPKESNDKKYINFSIKNLNYFDIRLSEV